MVLKTGTKMRPQTPMMSTSRRIQGATSMPSSFTSGRTMSPLRVLPSRSTGTTMQTRLGSRVFTMMLTVVTCPLIQSMMVVTSPMGLQAPPALAARMTMPAKSQRSFLSAMSLRRSATMTMAVVMLSSRAERKKVRMETTQRSFFLSVVLMRSVMTVKPL